MNMKKLDFKDTASRALQSAASILSHWLPHGTQQGEEWVCLNPTRADKKPGSFSVNTKTGLWSDFATGDKGGDLISLIAYIDDVANSEACRLLNDFLGGTPCPTKKATPVKIQEEILLPVPREAPEPPTRIKSLGEATAIWNYFDMDACLLMRVCRFDKKTETGNKKDYRPQTCWKDEKGRVRWQWKGIPDNRPLYNLHNIESAIDKTILLCEGEKAADAAAQLFPDIVCSTWPNGSKAINKADFSPLSRKNVYYWPDNDEAGKGSITKLKQSLKSVSVGSFRLLDLSVFKQWQPAENGGLVEGGHWPEKADAADALALGWSARHFVELEKLNPVFIEVSLGTGEGADLSDPGQSGSIQSRPDGLYSFCSNTLAWSRISAPIRVVGRSRDAHEGNWGCFVEFENHDGKLVSLNIPNRLMATENGTQILRDLLSRGFYMDMSSKARRVISKYLNPENLDARLTISEKTGWLKGCFVLPNLTIGQCREPIRYYTDQETRCSFDQKGSLEGWRENVSQLCSHNPRAIFTVSAAFCSFLLELLNESSFGIHWFGDSSGGKSTLLRLGASVCGHPKHYPKTWRGTDNGLEGTASAHSDSLLVLDEIGQCDPKKVGDVVYMFSQNEGKQRANESGLGREVNRWRIIFLSSGEKTLEDHMASAGVKINAGQEQRLLNIPSTGHEDEKSRQELGCFDCVADFAGGAAYSKFIIEECEKNYGYPLIEFVSKLIDESDKGKLRETIRNKVQTFKSGLNLQLAGQQDRAADKFALVGIAGELAKRWNIVAWEKGESMNAAKVCFESWLDNYGGVGSLEERQLLEQIKSKLLTYAEGRFTELRGESVDEDDLEFEAGIETAAQHGPRTVERWGFVRRPTKSMIDELNHGMEFWVFPQAFKNEICKGHSYKRALIMLESMGALDTTGADKAKNPLYARKKIPELGNNPKAMVIIKLSELI